MKQFIKFNLVIVFSIFFFVCYSYAGSEIPKDGLIFYGDLPSNYKTPSYHDVGMGYSGNNIMGINKTGKNILQWCYDEEFSSIIDASNRVKNACTEKGYKIAVASNVQVDLTTPLDSVFMIIYKYEINCW